MIRICLVTLSFLLVGRVSSQQPNMDDFNRQRQEINKKGLFAIGSWSAANIIYGGIASSRTSGSTKYFHKMNTIWNGVTLGLSAFGYLSAKKDAGLTYAQSLKQHAAIEKLFLANAAIDVAYIAGGLYIRERSKSASKNPEQSKGYGESIILQGSVLLLFDAVMFGIHNQHGKELYRIAEKVTFASTENGVGIVVRL